MTDETIKAGDLDHAAAGAGTTTEGETTTAAADNGAAANDAGTTSGATADTAAGAATTEEPQKSAETEGEKVEDKIEGDALLIRAAIHAELLKLQALVIQAKAAHPWAYHVEAALVSALEHMTA